ncbi:hypothetical protein [Streptomyces sp. NPDC005302]|uniref:hypothetical protein n=1 Tax=Streptomyces sp. NPDC005302 TaxID=3154675 RepID=UPI0033A649D4
MKVLRYWPVALFILAAVLLVAACDDPNAPASPSSVEIEHHYHHYPSHPKTVKPRAKVKAPAYRAPSRVGRRR